MPQKPPNTHVSSGGREIRQSGNPRGQTPDALHADTEADAGGEIRGDSLEPRAKPKHRLANVDSAEQDSARQESDNHDSGNT